MKKTARPTIAACLACIAMLAVGLAALRAPTLLWAQVVTTAALTALLIATVGAFVGSSRTFWVGFAIVGWSYLFLSLGPWCSDHVAPWLLSTALLDDLFFRMISTHPTIPGMGRAAWIYDFDFIRFHQIGHALGAIGHGVFGGVMALVLAGRHRVINDGGRP